MDVAVPGGLPGAKSFYQRSPWLLWVMTGGKKEAPLLPRGEGMMADRPWGTRGSPSVAHLGTKPLPCPP